VTDHKTIVIKTDLLAAIARWAYSEQDRPHIGRVIFRRDEIIATDGRRLVRLQHDCHGYEFGVSRRDVLAACAAQDMRARHHSQWAVRLGTDIEAGSDGDAVLTAGGMREVGVAWNGESKAKFGLGDDAYYYCNTSTLADMPKIDAVMLGARDGEFPIGRGFNIAYLAGMEQVVHAAGHSHDGTAIESWSNELGPFQFTSPVGAPPGEAGSVRFVIMPMRESRGGNLVKPRKRSAS
jgi:hypothetical protein